MALEGHRDEVVIDEMWTFIGRKDKPAWVWLALSRRNLQVIGLHIGGRTLDDAKQLWEQVPAPWKRCLVFTDAYPVYEQLFAAAPMQLCAGGRGEKETSEVEGVNNALRQRVSYLTRKTSSFARSPVWLLRRLLWMLFHWNKRQAKRGMDINSQAALSAYLSSCRRGKLFIHLWKIKSW